nr:hypothetical protein [Tanacetum cinerariifolium]
MVAILEKSEHNVYFHPMVDFVEASPLRYALTFKPTVYVSHIRQFWSTARIETTKEGTKILATVDGILRTITESSLRRNLKLQDEEGINGILRTVTESSLRRNLKLQDEEGISSLPDTKLFENLTLMGYNISPNQKFTFQKVADEPASPFRDVSQGEACPSDSGFIADQDMATIAKSSTLPHDSAPRVTSPAADEGKKVWLQQDLEMMPQSRGGIWMKREAAAERVSDDIEEMATVMTSIDAATVLASGAAEVPTGSGSIPTGSGSIPTAGFPAAEVPTGSDVVPTASLVFATAIVVARELEDQLEREDQRMSEQIAIDTEVARIHVEEELQSMIDRLDISNETVAKYLQEYQQFASELPLERRIELISDLVRYQDNYDKVHKFQTQQRNPWSKNQKRDYYMAIIRSNLGWKVKDFKGMTFEEIEAKFTTVWKQIEDFIPMGSKEEAERLKRKGLSLEQKSAKKLKTSEEVTEEAKSPDEVPKEKVHTEGKRSYWKITRLGGSLASYQFFIDMLKHLDREDLNQLWRIMKESLSNMPPTSDKVMELWVKLNKLYEPDEDDQLWTHTQNLMHAPVKWKLYDSCGVHHKDYPLRKGLAIVMISYKLQVENYSRIANDLILKIFKIASTPRQQGRIVRNKMHKAFPLPVIEFPLAEEPTTSEESSHCQKKRDAIAKRIALLAKVKE